MKAQDPIVQTKSKTVLHKIGVFFLSFFNTQ